MEPSKRLRSCETGCDEFCGIANRFARNSSAGVGGNGPADDKILAPRLPPCSPSPCCEQ